MIYNENMYSGSILTLNDIKLDKNKNLNRFYLVSYEENHLYDAIYSNSKVTILYYDVNTNSLFKDRSPSKDEEKRISSAIMILFRELGGHLKIHINNKIESPRDIFLPNLNLITLNLKKNDYGFLLEFLLSGDSIEISNFIYSEKSKELLNKNLYLGDNFEKLKNILISIGSKTIEKKILSEKDLVKFNYGILNYQQLTKLFNEMDEETFNNNQEVYKYYLSKFFGNPDKKC